MQTYIGVKLFKKYHVALGKQPVGAKQIEGDNKTPEGTYFITSRNANSRFYKNLGISYLNKDDLEIANSLGLPAGSDIKIHGLRNGQGWKGSFHRLRDWTAGCIAVTKKEMDELFELVADGAKVDIYP